MTKGIAACSGTKGGKACPSAKGWKAGCGPTCNGAGPPPSICYQIVGYSSASFPMGSAGCSNFHSGLDTFAGTLMGLGLGSSSQAGGSSGAPTPCDSCSFYWQDVDYVKTGTDSFINGYWVSVRLVRSASLLTGVSFDLWFVCGNSPFTVFAHYSSSGGSTTLTKVSAPTGWPSSVVIAPTTGCGSGSLTGSNAYWWDVVAAPTINCSGSIYRIVSSSNTNYTYNLTNSAYYYTDKIAAPFCASGSYVTNRMIYFELPVTAASNSKVFATYYTADASWLHISSSTANMINDEQTFSGTVSIDSSCANITNARTFALEMSVDANATGSARTGHVSMYVIGENTTTLVHTLTFNQAA